MYSYLSILIGWGGSKAKVLFFDLIIVLITVRVENCGQTPLPLIFDTISARMNRSIEYANDSEIIEIDRTRRLAVYICDHV